MPLRYSECTVQEFSYRTLLQFPMCAKQKLMEASGTLCRRRIFIIIFTKLVEHHFWVLLGTQSLRVEKFTAETSGVSIVLVQQKVEQSLLFN